MPLKTVEAAAEWVDEVGVALLFPNLDYVLPSLWEAISGELDVDWAIRDEEGKFESFTPSMDKLWQWKDDGRSGDSLASGSTLRARRR